ncbi:TMV resistance protein N-like [Populus nigra]|uniref:TMV resistance protein N-like n=1 Tax=Populus nigra TaxID=3691 RepID=UPI002B2720EA|nr:TMV resistance protein N-like [Populus nigra]
MLPLARWCLDELVKILERRQRTDQVVLPVLFYDTEEPSDVQKQTGSYAKALDEHEERFQEELEKVNKRRGALAGTGTLYGWDASIKEPDDSQAQGAYSKRLHDKNILQLCISQVPATAIRYNIRNQLEDRK